jgi:hypothetical protein
MWVDLGKSEQFCGFSKICKLFSTLLVQQSESRRNPWFFARPFAVAKKPA